MQFRDSFLSQYVSFPPSASFHQRSILITIIIILFSSEEQAGNTWEPWNKTLLLMDVGETSDRKVPALLFSSYAQTHGRLGSYFGGTDCSFRHFTAVTRPSLEATSFWAIHEIPCILWKNTNFIHRVHNRPTFAPIISQLNPVHTFPYFSELSSFYVCLPIGLPTKTLRAFLFSPIRAISPNHLVLFRQYAPSRSTSCYCPPPLALQYSLCTYSA
jgi:hypothetical protein